MPAWRTRSQSHATHVGISDIRGSQVTRSLPLLPALSTCRTACWSRTATRFRPGCQSPRPPCSACGSRRCWALHSPARAPARGAPRRRTAARGTQPAWAGPPQRKARWMKFRRCVLVVIAKQCVFVFFSQLCRALRGVRAKHHYARIAKRAPRAVWHWKQSERWPLGIHSSATESTPKNQRSARLRTDCEFLISSQ